MASRLVWAPMLLALLAVLGGEGIAQRSTPLAEVGIADQESSGHAIIVDVARLAQPGFVVIHDESLESGGGIDSIIGSSRALSAALHFDVLVRIDPPLTEDQRIIAMLHIDSNENGVFDLERTRADDGPYLQERALVMDDATIRVLDPDAAPWPGTPLIVAKACLAAIGMGRRH